MLQYFVGNVKILRQGLTNALQNLFVKVWETNTNKTRQLGAGVKSSRARVESLKMAMTDVACFSRLLGRHCLHPNRAACIVEWLALLTHAPSVQGSIPRVATGFRDELLGLTHEGW